MAGGTDADLPAMDTMARRLGESADALDVVGRRSPGIPQAGEVSGIMGAALTYLTDSAGNIVLGMKGASEEVIKVRQDYAAKDQSSADSFRGN